MISIVATTSVFSLWCRLNLRHGMRGSFQRLVLWMIHMSCVWSLRLQWKGSMGEIRKKSISANVCSSCKQRTLTIESECSLIAALLTTVRLTSCLTGLDLTKQVKLLFIQHLQSSWIQKNNYEFGHTVILPLGLVFAEQTHWWKEGRSLTLNDKI